MGKSLAFLCIKWNKLIGKPKYVPSNLFPGTVTFYSRKSRWFGELMKHRILNRRIIFWLNPYKILQFSRIVTNLLCYFIGFELSDVIRKTVCSYLSINMFPCCCWFFGSQKVNNSEMKLVKWWNIRYLKRYYLPANPFKELQFCRVVTPFIVLRNILIYTSLWFTVRKYSFFFQFQFLHFKLWWVKENEEEKQCRERDKSLGQGSNRWLLGLNHRTSQVELSNRSSY